MRKLNSKPGQPKYEKLANALAREYSYILPCVTCGYPAKQGYICMNEECDCVCGCASTCCCERKETL